MKKFVSRAQELTKYQVPVFPGASFTVRFDDIPAWLREQGWIMGREYRVYPGHAERYGFDDPDKAALFKLAWGGQ